METNGLQRKCIFCFLRANCDWRGIFLNTPNYTNFCVDDIANCYNEAGQLIHDENFLILVSNPDFDSGAEVSEFET